MLLDVSHDVEVKELFEKLTVEIPGLTDTKAISLEAFKIGIDIMMNKAFYYGAQNSMNTVSEIMDLTFNVQK
jgi:hypothetical protein